MNKESKKAGAMIDKKKRAELNMSKLVPILRLARYRAKIPNFGPGEGSAAQSPLVIDHF